MLESPVAMLIAKVAFSTSSTSLVWKFDIDNTLPNWSLATTFLASTGRLNRKDEMVFVELLTSL